MSVTVTYKAQVTAVETIEANAGDLSAADKTITHSGYNTSLTLTATTTPPVTKNSSFALTIASSAGSINLAALPGANNATFDATGLKMQILRLKAAGTNAAAITISKGAANGYAFSGVDGKLTLSPGQEITLFGNDLTPDVAAGARLLDLTGTDADVLDVQIVLG
jgi:hypothetical protein